MARAVVRAYPWLASVATVARKSRSRVPARATSDDPPGVDAGSRERVEPARQLGQPVAGHLRVEVVLQVVGELQEDGRQDPPAQGARLRQRRAAVVVVRQVNG